MTAIKIGKRGFTIGIKHYLNDKLKAKFRDRMSEFGIPENSYPLYVQITVKGQSLRVRSVLKKYFSQEEFEKYKVTNVQDMINESILIQRDILAQNPFEDPEFLLRWSWFSDDNLHEHEDELNNVVYTYLHIMFNNALNYYDGNMIRYERFWRREATSNLPCRVLTDEEYLEASNKHIEDEYGFVTANSNEHIWAFDPSTINYNSMYLSFFIPEVKRVRDMVPSEFWDFSSYHIKMTLKGGVDLLIVDDLFTGRFDSLFMSIWNDSAALKAIHTGFDTLCSLFGDLQERVEKIKNYHKL